jgi:hypothetical protein
MDKIQYTITFSQRPQEWDIPGAVKLLEAVRRSVIKKEETALEEISLTETKNLIEKIRRMK